MVSDSLLLAAIQVGYGLSTVVALAAYWSQTKVLYTSFKLGHSSTDVSLLSYGTWCVCAVFKLGFAVYLANQWLMIVASSVDLFFNVLITSFIVLIRRNHQR